MWSSQQHSGPAAHSASEDGGQQLHWAAHGGRVDEVRRLLDQGVHPDEYIGPNVSAAPPPSAVPRALLCGVVGSLTSLTLCCVRAGVLCGRTGSRR